MSRKQKLVAEMTVAETANASRRLFSTTALEKALIEEGFTIEAVAAVAARYLRWITEEMDKGRTSFVAKDVVKLMDFIQSTAVQREKLGLDEKAYKAILSQGNKSVLENVDAYKKACNERTD